MTYDFYRIHLIHRDAEAVRRDDYHFDLFLDPSGNPAQKVVYFGLWGEMGNPGNRFPVILLPDGRIDFGAEEEDAARYHTTNLLEKKIFQGELFTVSVPRDDSPTAFREMTLEVKSARRLADLVS
ncbi:MAG TPA: hypothetical protein VGV37_04645 [Aliidongia sp.]|uniref:hypothetical protein n=1 Tax=Aliidongia sp. TaxID=1914230 RepID=UPI002DDD7BB6|nr:hypothetical protein [Aliidongia sp.]HEV2673807.1 hypothetical protein [Aliidongia sp.]